MEKDVKSVVLVVDDNEEILEFISDDLSKKFEVLTGYQWPRRPFHFRK